MRSGLKAALQVRSTDAFSLRAPILLLET